MPRVLLYIVPNMRAHPSAKQSPTALRALGTPLFVLGGALMSGAHMTGRSS